jgi:membrane fusion protein, multidrug efflux system
MNRVLVFSGLAIIKLASIALLVMLYGCNQKTDVKSGKEVAKESAAVPALVPTQLRIEATDLYVVKSGNISATVTISGSLKAQKQSLVKSKSGGEVVSLGLKDGDIVKSGQRVAQIDDLDAKLRLNERLAARKANQAQLELAQRVYQNQRQLFDKGFISQAALDSAQTQLDVARANLDAAQASLKVVEKQINDSVLISPISGVVAEVFVQVGEKVSSDARLLSVVDLNSIEFEASVPADLTLGITVGQTISIRIDGATQEVIGRVERINPTTQSGSRAIPVHVSLGQAAGNLKVGMFAEGRFVTAQKNNVIVVPTSAIREASGRKFVYIIGADQQIQERNVQLGLNDPNAVLGNRKGMTEISQGLKNDEQIIAGNLGPIRAGTLIAQGK